MTFLELGKTHIITTIVKVESFDCFPIPEDEKHYCVNIICSGLQFDSADKFPVQLAFNQYLNSQQLTEVMDCYELGKLVSVTGNFYVQINDGSFYMTIYDPIASYLPEIAVKQYEKNMGESYLPQKTYECLY